MERDKNLRSMSIYELVKWLGKLCKLWSSKHSKLSEELPEIEREMEKTMITLLGLLNNAKWHN